MNSFFGGGGSNSTGRSSGPRKQKGSDLEYRVNLKFEDAIFGKEEDITYERMDRCQTCHGNGAKPGTKPEECSNCHGSGYVVQQVQSLLESNRLGEFVRYVMELVISLKINAQLVVAAG